jgi:hypothetical protein
MRRWDAIPNNLRIPLAADARLSHIDADNDQIWEVMLGKGTRPAIALQTQYGGRVGLCSLVPLWIIGSDTIYEHVAYYRPPQRILFTTNYQYLEASIIEGLDVGIHIWAIDSQHLGVQYHIQNHTDSKRTIRLDLFGHLAAQGKELPLGIVTLSDEGHALYMGELSGTHPIVQMQGGHAQDTDSARIGTTIDLEAGSSKHIRWVHSGTASVRESIRLGRAWLKRSWTNDIKRIKQAHDALPHFRTGKENYDILLSYSAIRHVQSMIPTHKNKQSKPTWQIVGTRNRQDGYRAQGYQQHHNWAWHGYDVYMLWQIAPTLKQIAPTITETLLARFVDLQKSDGSIHLPSHPNTPDQSLLCPPLLAQIGMRLLDVDHKAWQILFDKLYAFLKYWLNKNDGPLAWQDERQMNYVAFPTFGNRHGWAQGLDVKTVSSPDLLVYILQEARTLEQVAKHLGQKDVIADLQAIQTSCHEKLQSQWNGKHFTYESLHGHSDYPQDDIILQDGQGDETHTLNMNFETPSHLLISIVGGTRHTPTITLRIIGKDVNGQDVTLEAQTQDFAWHYRRGLYTLPIALSHLESVQCEGLSRVYTINITQPEYGRLDINSVMPLLLPDLTTKQKQNLIRLLKDEDHFLRPNGMTIVSAQDPNFDASSSEGGGGIWLYWMLRMSDALLQHGEEKLVVDLVKRLLELQSVLVTLDDTSETLEKSLGQFYNSDQPKAYGDANHVVGLLPPSLMLRLMGLRLLNHGQTVGVYPEFAWNRSIAVEQFGMSVRRTRKRLTIKFASGEKITTDVPETYTEFHDPQPTAWALPDVTPVPEPTNNASDATRKQPKQAPSSTSRRININVEVDES